MTDVQPKPLSTWPTMLPKSLKSQHGFYSGQTNNKGKTIPMYTKITELQAKIGHNCTVIGDLVPAAGQRSWNPDWPVCPDWSKMSEQFAKVVKGTVYVLLGKDVYDTSCWKVLEYPTLKNNQAVTKIKIFELDTAGEIVAKYHDDINTHILFRPDPSFLSISPFFYISLVFFNRYFNYSSWDFHFSSRQLLVQLLLALRTG